MLKAGYFFLAGTVAFPYSGQLFYLALIKRSLFQVSISSGELPSSIETMHITNCEDMSVAKDTFSHLQDLQRIHFGDVQRVSIASNNWSRIRRPEHVMITIDRLSELVLESGAFSGWADSGARIAIRHVASCFISTNAFESDSTIQSVVLQNIPDLFLESNAFQTDVDQLEFDNISLAFGFPCGPFSGRIRNLSLRSVTAKSKYVGSKCLHVGDGCDSLTVRSSDLGDIQPFGINGTVNDVVIEDSRLGHVDPQGLRLNTSTFTMKSTMIKELATDALDIVFNQSASFETSSIDVLRRNAFRRLEPRSGSPATLVVRQLLMNNTEHGSLAFSKQTEITLLDIVLREPCDCSVDELFLQLVTEDALRNNATDEQRDRVLQLVDQIRCTSGTNTPTLAEFYDQSCSADDQDKETTPMSLLHEPCECGVDEPLGDTVLGDTLPRNATDEQRRNEDQVRCTDGANTPTLAEFYRQNCSVHDKNTTSLSLRAVPGDWIWPVAVGTSLIVLALVGASVTMAKRRRDRFREERPAEDDSSLEPVSKILEISEPTLSVIPGTAERPTTPSAGSFSRPGHRQSLQSVAEYSEIIDPDQLPPPSDEYIEIAPPPSDEYIEIAPPPSDEYIEIAPPPSDEYIEITPPPSDEYIEIAPPSAETSGQSVSVSPDTKTVDEQQHLSTNCIQMEEDSRQLVYENLHA